MTWRATILTLFPEMFPGPLGESIAAKANAKGLWQLDTVNIRDFALPPHGTVDEKPFGGGTGMVMRPDVLAPAIEVALASRQSSVVSRDSRLIYFSPRGKIFDQRMAEELAACKDVIMLCGRYEGVDQRILDHYAFEEISLGDFILSGGEIAALAVIDACLRLLPGVISKPSALEEESFGQGAKSAGLLEYSHYTRPAVWQGYAVPEVLVSGHHEKIREWRKAEAENITQRRRPDLWEKYRG